MHNIVLYTDAISKCIFVFLSIFYTWKKFFLHKLLALSQL
jgi:hypothetical protein